MAVSGRPSWRPTTTPRSTGSPSQHAAVARYFAALLDRLGFRATTRLLELEPYFSLLATHPEQVQMAGFWVLSSTRSGSDMIRGIFTCPDFPVPWGYVGEPSGFCSRRIDADVTRAEALDATDPIAANHLWARIDAAYVDAAPAVMAINPTDVTFLSERVGGYEHHPVYQIMLDQLWIR